VSSSPNQEYDAGDEGGHEEEYEQPHKYPARSAVPSVHHLTRAGERPIGRSLISPFLCDARSNVAMATTVIRPALYHVRRRAAGRRESYRGGL